MNYGQRVLRRTLIVSAAVGVAAVGVAAAPAQASPGATPEPLGAPEAAALATEVDSAGTYRDPAGDMVVTVTTQAQADQVRADGGRAELVTYSGPQLQEAVDRLNRDALIPGTAWSIDPTTNQVVVTTDDTVTGPKRDRLDRVTDALGDRVRVEAEAGTLSALISGGDAIFAGGSRCSVGFNATDGATDYFITAGHCTNISNTWYSDGGSSQLLGNTVATSFPGDDYGVVQYTTGVGRPGDVQLYNGSYRDITGAANAYVGEPVTRSGSTTGVFSGTVQGLNATVNYQEGSVFGTIRTNVCAEPGDSGGALFDGSTALGLTSGGKGNCSSGGTTYFQPITEPLNLYGLSVY